MHETILELARTVSGAGEAETALLEALCQAAEAAWTGRLREGVAAEDCGTAFPCAAAFTAAADLAAGRGAAAQWPPLRRGTCPWRAGAGPTAPPWRRPCGTPPSG